MRKLIENNVEKLYSEDSPDDGFIRGILPRLPFKEDIKNESESIRVFKSDTKEEDLVWHRDREDRIVKCLEKTNWKFQFDNELPISFDNEIFIPKGVYHRIIKGDGDLVIEVTKLNP